MCSVHQDRICAGRISAQPRARSTIMDVATKRWVSRLGMFDKYCFLSGKSHVLQEIAESQSSAISWYLRPSTRLRGRGGDPPLTSAMPRTARNGRLPLFYPIKTVSGVASSQKAPRLKQSPVPIIGANKPRTMDYSTIKPFAISRCVVSRQRFETGKSARGQLHRCSSCEESASRQRRRTSVPEHEHTPDAETLLLDPRV